MAAHVSRHSYKELTFQQLRSFCETARLGSLAGAAASLRLAQPTVWEQVHTLERAFAVKLVEPHRRGCRLTEAGRLLAELAAPLVTGVASLERNFQETRAQIETKLTIAASQRILVEDLPQVIVEFERRHPQVRLRIVDVWLEEVPSSVESGAADLGLTTEREPNPPNPRLSYEPGYELDVILVTTKDHPLARARRVGLRELRGFPIVNSVNTTLGREPTIMAALDKIGVIQTPPHVVEAVGTSVIRRYVELGFGIGLILGVPSRAVQSNLHEQSMSRHFGQVTVNLVQRKQPLRVPTLRAFVDTIKTVLNQRPADFKARTRARSGSNRA